MNILWIAGEATNWALGYCRELAELDNTILLVGNSEDLYDKDNLDSGSVNLKLLPFKDFNYINIIEIANKENFKPDLVFGSHVNMTFNAYQISQKLRIPWGMMILDIPSDLLKSDRKRMKLWNSYFECLKQADQIIFNTEVARDEFYKFTNNYIDNVITYTPNILKEYKDKPINLSPENYVVSVCRLTKIKNCSIIPYALSLLKNKPKYIAIGRDGGDLDSIKSLCKHYNVEFEHIPEASEEEKFRIIYNASALIYPQESEYIGGLSPFEAMAVGTPAIVSDYKILRDLYGRRVFYFKHMADLSEKIALFCNLDKKEFSNSLELSKECAIESDYELMAYKINYVLEGMK